MARTIRTERFTLDRTAYLKATWLLPLRGRLVLLVGTLAVLVVAGFVTGQKGLAYGGLIGGAVGVPLALTARYATDRRRLHSSETAQAFDDPRRMEFTDKGFRARTEGGVESLVPWSHVQKARRRGGFVLLSIARNLVCVPESAFAPGDLDALWATLAEKGIAKK